MRISLTKASVVLMFRICSMEGIDGARATEIMYEGIAPLEPANETDDSIDDDTSAPENTPGGPNA